MNSGRLVLILILFAFGPGATLVAQKCPICDSALGVYHYRVRDQFGDEEKLICSQCMLLKERCFLCGLPVKNGLTRLRDGRVFCARDVNEVVLSDDDAKSICSGTKNELGRIFSRFLTFPDTNVVISMVDRVHMNGLFESAGFDRQCPSVFGYVKSRIVEDEKWKHPISILNAVPKARLMATCAHELTHCWLKENLSPDRDLDRDAIEGFCELVAYKLMEYMNEERGKKFIKSNLYTRGQIQLFIEADNQYGFYTIMEWMKYGVDRRLQEEDLDRVRKTEPRLRQPAAAAVNVWSVAQAPAPVPDTLTLLGLSGSGTNCMVLINDRSFHANESGKVRYANTNAWVRCIEIRDNSVVIQVEGTAERQELFLKAK